MMQVQSIPLLTQKDYQPSYQVHNISYSFEVPAMLLDPNENEVFVLQSQWRGQEISNDADETLPVMREIAMMSNTQPHSTDQSNTQPSLDDPQPNPRIDQDIHRLGNSQQTPVPLLEIAMMSNTQPRSADQSNTQPSLDDPQPNPRIDQDMHRLGNSQQTPVPLLESAAISNIQPPTADEGNQVLHGFGNAQFTPEIIHPPSIPDVPDTLDGQTTDEPITLTIRRGHCLSDLI
ncbi:hypothetical protein AALO_G00223120 [Alosa alosa]|uniref:Uncharacterized protein n=1 Tax=Alosa alosa TaxID=278164 RepID=A0AAV6FYP7_9TELE|nr:uncharacterized protein LOC125310567 [Alosa alosa]XP_048124066.1 uncharacterized protein LOC125310567 [Alosa alosa]KAG5267564.1 hypothetical protein AALO_G00223120 [Alosa alosa]